MNDAKRGFYIETKKAEVSSIAVMDGHKILMGKRRDSNKWTLPGGHLEKDEKKENAARRELKEEANLDIKNLKHLGSKKIISQKGKKIVIHSFKTKHDGSNPSAKNDPDKEVKKWHWIDVKKFPKHIIENLHSKRNVTLQKLGIQKSFYIYLSKTKTEIKKCH